MIFKRVNRTLAETIFLVYQANETGMAAGDVAQLELTAASADGVKICQPNANELNAVVGIIDAAISNGAYGLVQVYGYRSSAKILGSGTSIKAGMALVPLAGSDHLGAYDANGTTPLGNPLFFAVGTVASSAGTGDTTTAAIFIRCM